MWRLATELDDQTIVALSLELYREDPSDRPVLRDGIQRTLEKLRESPDRGRSVAFTQNDQILGYALLISFWSNELAGEICIVDELFIKRDSRGKGHGSSLFEEIRTNRKLWSTPPVAIELEVTPDNSRARALYSELGFKPKKNDSMRLDYLMQT